MLFRSSHLNHFTFTLPIFHKKKLVGFACCMAHWLDVGGVLGGMTTDIFSEGIQIPILKYQDQGKVNEDLLDIIKMNVRLPPRAMGDLRAQVTAVKTGERRFLELIERRDPTVSRMEEVHRQHTRCLEQVVTSLMTFGVKFTTMERSAIQIGRAHV